MRDWGWENHVAGTTLIFGIHFKLIDTDISLINWAKKLKLPDYKFFLGPFNDENEICRFFIIEHYDKLVDQFFNKTNLSYGDYIHQIWLFNGSIHFHRSWGSREASISDILLLNNLFQLDIEVGEWYIQDGEYGNYWIQSNGLNHLKEYLQYNG